ncbi:hypothetical protein Pcinc_000069 [Petrolisthes cinctipes]|uniref:Ionotropic glutamate receptor C-terminal domain-containing protein n=1 Tax=Petrolisthes cinctipes TaxID=88211 RepID=A0AAE1GQ82_PETCI|nr:hypothetical protein Pcinc_000069 [Petrolisthes cinctipes]
MNNAYLHYELQHFLSTTPTDLILLHHRPPISDGLFCVAFYLLAPLPAITTAIDFIPKSKWFSGALRYMISYTGGSLDISTLEADPILFSASHTLYVSHNPFYNHNQNHNSRNASLQKYLPLDLLANCPYCRDGEAEVVVRGRWLGAKRGGLHGVSTGDLFPDPYVDCNGHVFEGVYKNFPPFSHYSSGNSTHPLVLEKSLDKLIFDAISALHNFSYLVNDRLHVLAYDPYFYHCLPRHQLCHLQMYEPKDGLWGFESSPGNYTGVVGEVQHRLYDFSVSLTITYDRGQEIDFTIDYYPLPLCFVTSKPKQLPQYLAVIRPFRGWVWAGVGVMLGVGGVTLWMLEGVAATHKPMTLQKALFVTFASLLTQSRQWPQYGIVRIYLSFWLVFCLVATVSYFGNLTAFLTVPAFTSTIDSLQELVRSDFSWGVNDYGAADYQLLLSSKEPLYQEIFRGISFCPSLLDCIQRTLDERYAFISFKTYVRDAIATHFTDRNGDTQVYMAKESFFPAGVGIGMQKGSPFRHVFDKELRKLLEGGFPIKWVTDLIQEHALEGRRMAAANDGGSVSEGNGQLTFTLYHLQGVFMVTGTGLLLSAFVFGLELILYKMI